MKETVKESDVSAAGDMQNPKKRQVALQRLQDHRRGKSEEERNTSKKKKKDDSCFGAEPRKRALAQQKVRRDKARHSRTGAGLAIRWLWVTAQSPARPHLRA